VLNFGVNITVTRQRTEAGSFAHNTKPSDPVQDGELLHYLSDYCILRNDFDECS